MAPDCTSPATRMAIYANTAVVLHLRGEAGGEIAIESDER
jgi:hypothetical protein